MGESGVLRVDDVQWMTAGRGVLHSEMPRGGFHGLQLWVNLPASQRMRPARYQNLPAAVVPSIARDGARIRVVAGEHDGVRGVAETNTRSMCSMFDSKTAPASSEPPNDECLPT